MPCSSSSWPVDSRADLDLEVKVEQCIARREKKQSYYIQHMQSFNGAIAQVAIPAARDLGTLDTLHTQYITSHLQSLQDSLLVSEHDVPAGSSHTSIFQS